MISREDEEKGASWVVFMWSHSLPVETKQSVMEAIEREDRVFIQFPRKKRTLRIPISTPSYTTALEENVTEEDPPKANIIDEPLTKPPSKRKRCSLLLRPTEEKPKKAKRKANGRFDAGASSSGTREPTPEWLVRLMRVKKGENPINFINKELTATDVKSGQRRLSMPFGQIKDFDFLSPAEKRIIEEHANNEREEGVDVILVASDLREFKLNLRRWVMGTSPLYILVSGWNKVVKECRLEEGNKIRLWSFHVNDQLYIAMVPLSPTESGKSVSERISPALVIKDKANDGLPHK